MGGTGILRKYLKLVSASILVGFLVSCSQEAAPPSIYSPQKKISYDGCRNTSFNPNELTPTSVRALVTCLDGSENALGPVKGLVDSMPDQDLQVFVDVFDRNITKKEKRLSQIVDLVSRLRENGALAGFYKSFSVLTRTESLQDLLAWIGQVHQKAASENMYFQNSRLLRKFVTEAIRANDVDANAVTLAKTFDSFKARALAYFLSREKSTNPLGWPEITDEVAELVSAMLVENDLHRMAVLGADPAVFRNFKSLGSDEAVQIQNAFRELTRGSSQKKNTYVQAFQNVTIKTDRPMVCFDNGQASRKFENLFDACADEESRRRKDPARLARFWAVEVPVLLAASLEHCDLDPKVIEDSKSMAELSRVGVAPGMAAAVVGFYDTNRSDYLKRILKSPLFVQSAALIENLAARQGISYLLDLFYRDQSEADFQSLMKLVTQFTVKNLEGASLENWLDSHLKEPSLSKIKLFYKGLKEKNLWTLLAQMEKAKLDLEVHDLRVALAEVSPSETPESALSHILQIGLLPEYRAPLKAAVNSLVKSWKDSDGGWGTMLGVFATGIGMADEKPIQSALLDLLDPKDSEALGPALGNADAFFSVLSRLSQDSKFRDSLKYFGEMAQSGDLDTFVSFVLDLFRLAGEKGLSSKPSSSAYQSAAAYPNPTDLEKSELPGPQAPQGQFDECSKIKGDLFRADGDNLYHALKCFNYNNGAQGFSDLAELLFKSGLLPKITEILSKKFMNQDHINGILDDLKLMYDSGDLKQLLTLLSLAVEPPYYLHDRVDSFVHGLFSSERTDHALEGLGTVLNSDYFPSGTKAALSAFDKEPKLPYLKSVNNYPLSIFDPADLKAQALKAVPTHSPAEFEKAVLDFSERTPDYYYEQGLYSRYQENDLKQEITQFFEKLLRTNPDKKTGDLEELLNALSDLANEDSAGKLDFTGFVHWASSSRRVVPYYVGTEIKPRLRVVTPFDQMDILVANANISVMGWTSGIPGAGTDHMGIYFETQIAKSTNFKETLDALTTKLKMGLGFCAIPSDIFISKEVCNKLKNDKENFYVLYEMAELGYLRVFQRLYQAFRYATPNKYYDKEDPETNHIFMAHKHTDWGFLARIVAPLSYIDSKGLLKPFIKSILRIAATTQKDDQARMRSLLGHLLETQQGRTHLRDFIDQFARLQDSPEAFATFKETLFHLALTWPRITDRNSGIIEIADLLSRDPEIIQDGIRWLFDDARKIGSESLAHKISVNLAHLDTSNAAYLKQIGTLLLQPTALTQDSYALSLGDLFLSSYRLDKNGFTDLWNTMNSFSADTRVLQVDPHELAERVVLRYDHMRKVLAEVLLDSRDRQDVRELLDEMSRSDQKLLGNLIKTIVGLHQSGDLENLIFFLNKHAISSGH
jgi:hypothetical protein